MMAPNYLALLKAGSWQPFRLGQLATFFWRRSLARLLDKHLGLTANGAWCSVLCAGYLGWGDMVVIAQVNDSRGAARSTNVV